MLRRLIRRTLTTLWRGDPSRTLSDLPSRPIDDTLGHFELNIDSGHVRQVLLNEERRFKVLLQRGREVVSRTRSRGPLSEEDFRFLHDTHGLPRELVLGLLSELA